MENKTKNKIIIALMGLFGLYFLFSQCNQFVKSENVSGDYNIYVPQNITNVAKTVSQAQKDSQIIFIVDFSNSMNEAIDGRSKIDIARETLGEILPRIPKEVKTGLRVYGHKGGFTYFQGCQA